MTKTEKLGIIWNILYLNTDLEEQGLKVLAEKVLEALEKEEKECQN